MTAFYDKLRCILTTTCLVAERFLSPGGTRGLGCSMPPAVTSTVGVVSCSHNNAANRWPNSFMACAASLANLNVLVLLVANASEACRAVDINEPNFTAG